MLASLYTCNCEANVAAIYNYEGHDGLTHNYEDRSDSDSTVTSMYL